MDVECEWDEESIYTLSDDEAKEYHNYEEDLKSHRSSVRKINPSLFASPRKKSEPDSVFRKNATRRISSNKLKYPQLMATQAEHSSQYDSLTPRVIITDKKMLIAFTEEKAVAT